MRRKTLSASDPRLFPSSGTWVDPLVRCDDLYRLSTVVDNCDRNLEGRLEGQRKHPGRAGCVLGP